MNTSKKLEKVTKLIERLPEDMRVSPGKVRELLNLWGLLSDPTNDFLVEEVRRLLDLTVANTINEVAEHVESHSCVSSCCGAQPSGGEAKQLADCVRSILKRPMTSPLDNMENFEAKPLVCPTCNPKLLMPVPVNHPSWYDCPDCGRPLLRNGSLVPPKDEG